MTSCLGRQPDRNAQWKPPRNSITCLVASSHSSQYQTGCTSLPSCSQGSETGGVKASGFSLTLLG